MLTKAIVNYNAPVRIVNCISDFSL
jgi:hypothetical protein